MTMAKKKKKKQTKRNPPARATKRTNAPTKFRKVTGSSGWIKATRIKFLKTRGNPVQVLVERPRRRAKKKK